jgi:hypothetical protein
MNTITAHAIPWEVNRSAERVTPTTLNARTTEFLTLRGRARQARLAARAALVVSLASLWIWASPTLAQGDPLEVWHARASGVTTALNADAYGNGLFVAVGNQGTIVTSPSGVTWTRRTSGTTLTLNSMVFANGLFVVVGEGGVIRTSANGTTWTARNSGTGDFLYDVCYGNGRFIAVSDTGTVVTSTNGLSWTARSGGVAGSYGVACGNGNFVSVGGILNCPWPWPCYYTSVAYASGDAAAWTPTSPGAGGLLSDLAFGKGILVAVGDVGSIVSSTNGSNWTVQTSGASEFLPNVAYGNGTFVVVGALGGIFTSTDGGQWAPRTSGTTSGLYNITYGNGTFVAVGEAGTIRQSDVVVSPVQLDLSRVAGQLQLSWPTAAGSYSIEQTDDLKGGAWSPTAESAVAVGDRTVVTLEPQLGSHFYRLVSGP